MNTQELFNKVAHHLLTQSEPARGPSGMCQYRAPGGLACAVGCLIPDDKYDPSIEGLAVSFVRGRIPDLDSELISDDFLQELQGIHDEMPVESWKRELRALAEDYTLSVEVVDSFTWSDDLYVETRNAS